MNPQVHFHLFSTPGLMNKNNVRLLQVAGYKYILGLRRSLHERSTAQGQDLHPLHYTEAYHHELEDQKG